jgi:hypothetical protein
MRLPKRPRNFDDLFDRIIFEQDGESAVGNVFSKLGASVSNTMKDAYNITANPLGLGAAKTELSQEHKTFYQEYNIPPKESQIMEMIINEYKTNVNCQNEIKLKSLRLSSGESVTFNLVDWDKDKRLTYKTLVLNKNDAVLKDNKIFQTFYTKFAQSDMSRFPLDPLFLAHLDDILDNYLNSNTQSTALSGSGVQSNNSEKTQLQTNILNYIKKIKQGKKAGTYKDPSLYFKVFLTFISAQKGSQLF